MSKTIRKMPWAVPGLAAVALAAFLAIGLLTANGVQQAEAQDDPCIQLEAIDGAANNGDLACSVTGTEAIVELLGKATDGANDDVVFYVYYPVSSGEDIVLYPPGTTYTDGGTPPFLNKPVKFGYKLAEIDAAKRGAGGLTAQSDTVTVNGEAGEAVVVYVYHTDGPAVAAIGGAPAGSSNALPAIATNRGATLTITFLGAPAIGVDGDDPNKIVDDSDDADSAATPPVVDSTPNEIRSMLQSFTGAASTAVVSSVTDGGSADHVLTTTENEVKITATVTDAGDNPLADVEVTFTATSDPAGVEGRTRTEDSAADGTASRTIGGLPTDSGYRVTVAVSADGVNLGSIVIARSGDLATFTALICAEDTGNSDTDDGCGADSRPQSVFGDLDGTFRIVTTAQDALGSAAAGVSVEADEDADGIDVAAFDTDGVADGGITEADAEGGRYTITLTATQGSGANEIELMTTVEVTISGPLATYEVTGPDNIESGTSQTFTVMALDSLGNPAQFATGQQVTVDVFVEGSAKNSVTVFGVPARGLDLADDGEASFRIRAASDAMDGEITIVVSGVATIDEATKTVTIGDAPALVLGDASGLMAEPGTAAGTVELTWMPGDNATRHFVAGVKRSDLDAGTLDGNLIWTFADDSGSHTVAGLDSGEEYLFVVIAGDADGWGNWTTPPQMVTPS